MHNSFLNRRLTLLLAGIGLGLAGRQILRRFRTLDLRPALGERAAQIYNQYVEPVGRTRHVPPENLGPESAEPPAWGAPPEPVEGL